MPPPPDRQPPPAAAGVPAAISPPRRWILVADDDANVRAVWTQALEKAGYAVIGCGDGHEACEIMRAVVPDLLILDLHMPRVSGGDLLERVRQHPILRLTPVLIVSGYLNEEHVATGDLNVVGRIEKPARLRDILETVQRILEPGPTRPRTT